MHFSDLFNPLSSASWTHLVEALLHTLWIGLLCAAGTAVVLRNYSAKHPRQRQSACIAGLLATLICGLIAWSVLEQESAPAPSPSAYTISTPAPKPAEQPHAQTDFRSIEAASPPNAPRRLSAWAAALWLLGVTAMLGRILYAVAGAGTMRRKGRPVPQEHPLNRITNELLVRLGSARNVTVLLIDKLAAPAVMGAIRPVILWPAAGMTGLPEWQVRAILAHELAHVVRRDYLVNLLQMVIEALLFFNPAVWWMSRQLRIEREACCDALAADCLGDSGGFDIARTLADLSGAAPAAALAFGAGHHGSLLSRVRRLLDPGHRPAIRLPWPTLIGLLLLISLTLAGLKLTGDTVAAKIMSNAERMTTMAALKKRNPDYQQHFSLEELKKIKDLPPATVKGTVRMADGSKLPDNLELRSYSFYQRHASVDSCTLLTDPGSLLNPDGTELTFAHEFRPGEIDFSLSAKGFAPQFAGPVTAEPGDTVEDIHFVIDRGFRTEIQLKDNNGNPIADAEIGIQSEEPTHSWRPAATTGKDGRAVIEHASSAPVTLEVRHPGYAENTVKHVVLLKDQPYAWTLKKAVPVTGQVFDTEQGNPLADVEFRIQERKSEKLGNMGWQSVKGPLLGTSNAEGRYSLDTVDGESTYSIIAQTADLSHVGFFTLHPGERGKTVHLSPTFSVSGTIADADRLSPIIDLYWNERFFHTQGFRQLSGRVDVRKDGTNTTFALHGALPGKIMISGSGLREELTVKESTTDVVLNDGRVDASTEKLQAVVDAAHPLRTVKVHLQMPEDACIDDGSITAEYSWYEARPETERGYTRISDRFSLPIDSNGNAVLDIPTPNSLTLTPQNFNGFWFPESYSRIESNDTPHEITLNALPAGAIEGKIFDQHGQPAKGLMISIRALELPQGNNAEDLGIKIKNSSGSRDDSSQFLAGPLPLDGTYQIVAHSGRNFAVSKPVQLTAEQPFPKLEIRMPESVDLTGRVTGPDNEPVKGAAIDLTVVVQEYGYGSGDTPLSRPDGNFVIPAVNPSLPRGSIYSLQIMPASNYVPASIEFRAVKKPLRLKLKRGRTVSGIVVDKETGRPLKGVEVYAHGTQNNWHEEKPSYINADALTDSEGQFRFTRLQPNRPYIIRIRGGRLHGHYRLPADETPDFRITVEPDQFLLSEYPQY